MNSLRDYSIPLLLPDSLRNDDFVVALGEAFETEMKEMYREAEILSNFYDLDKIPEQLLDHIAYEKHVDFYDSNIPFTQKMNLVRQSVAWHRKKGTPWAVEQVISVIFPRAKTIEWFEYGGDPYKFLIQLDLDDDFLSFDKPRLKRLLDATKNKRSQLEKILFQTKVSTKRSTSNKVDERIRIYTKLNPWVLAGLGTDIGLENVYLDGNYKLDGEAFLNSYIQTDGPQCLTTARLIMKVAHDFGVHEVSIVPVLDGVYMLNGELLLQHDLQTARITVKQEAKTKQRQRIVASNDVTQRVQVTSMSRNVSGVYTLNGGQNLNGNISLNQTLLNNKGLFRVKKQNAVVEEVAV
ncbi:Phage tail protein (Tail_P2_I) [Anoxybacillus sp. BCO1]|nr:Phage tail protein (Tail_P2_I) [Anoxybacillus sp. BCO1]